MKSLNMLQLKWKKKMKKIKRIECIDYKLEECKAKFEINIDGCSFRINLEERFITDIKDFTPYLKDDYKLDHKVTEENILDLIDTKKIKFYYVYGTKNIYKTICLLNDVNNLNFNLRILGDRGEDLYAELTYNSVSVSKIPIESKEYAIFLNNVFKKIKNEKHLNFNYSFWKSMFPYAKRQELLEIVIQHYMNPREFEKNRTKKIFFITETSDRILREKIYIDDYETYFGVSYNKVENCYYFCGNRGKIEFSNENIHSFSKFILENHLNVSDMVNSYFQYLFDKYPYQQEFSFIKHEFLEKVKQHYLNIK